MKLRYYQKKMLLEAWAGLDRYKVQMIQAPTGAGKSVIMTTGIKLLTRQNKAYKFLIISPRIEINKQLIKYLVSLGIERNCEIITNLNRKIYKDIARYDFLVVDECFSSKTKVKTENGYKKIKDIKIGDLVYSFNGKDFELKEVVKLFKKNYDDNFIKLNFNNSNKTIDSTKNHKFYTLNGQKRADELEVGDYIISMPRKNTQKDNISYHFNKQQEQILIGSYLGDGGLKNNRIRLTHGEKQKDYLLWKVDFLKNLITQEKINENKSGYNPNNKIFSINTNILPFLSEFNIDYCLDNIKELGLAIWFMDDGSLVNKNYTLNTHSFTFEEHLKIQEKLFKKFKIKGKIREEKRCNKFYLYFSREESRLISSLIKNYVCNNLQYKLLETDKNQYSCRIDDFLNYGLAKITAIKEIKRYNNNLVYNIEVKDNHNYLVGNNLLVSNCHHFSASTYQKLWQAANPNCRLFGFTATPMTEKRKRLDDKMCGLWAYFLKDGMTRYDINYIECEMQTAQLINQGFLSKFKIIPEYKVVENLINKARKITNAVLREQSFIEIVGMIPKHKILKALENSKSAIAFCNSIDYCIELEEYLNKHGITAEILVSDTDKIKIIQDREVIVNSFKNGDFRVLLGVNIFNEGFDCPAIDTALCLRPTNSLIIYLQQIGRILRKSKDKTMTYMYDFVGNAIYFGAPDSDWGWRDEFWLEKEPKEKDIVKFGIKECPICKQVMSGNAVRNCPYCKFDFYKWNLINGKEAYLKELWKQTEKNEVLLHEGFYIKQTRNEKGVILHLQLKKLNFYWAFYQTNVWLHQKMLKEVNEICHFNEPLTEKDGRVFYKCKKVRLQYKKENNFNKVVFINKNRT